MPTAPQPELKTKGKTVSPAPGILMTSNTTLYYMAEMPAGRKAKKKKKRRKKTKTNHTKQTNQTNPHLENFLCKIYPSNRVEVPQLRKM